jgi:hypothetical protein
VWSPSTGAWAQQGPFPLYGVKSLVADSSGDVVAAAWQSGQVMVSELPAGSGTWTTPVAIPSSQPAVLGLRWYFGDRRKRRRRERLARPPEGRPLCDHLGRDRRGRPRRDRDSHVGPDLAAPLLAPDLV